MQLVTGGAGFIGSTLVRALNDRGVTDVVVVDNLERGEKFKNLSDCQIADYLDKRELRAALADGRLRGRFSAIFHQGACTDTLEPDGRYLLDNNFTFSKELLELALADGIPFIYASSASIYGNQSDFAERPENERPLNVYGYSKLAFDQYVRRVVPRARNTLVGLRYFNVYGPRETLKGRMASMVHHLHRQVSETGVAKLFEGTEGYEDGEQRRDFVFVDDVVRVNLHFADGPPRQGIFNVGTGVSHSFNELARMVIAFHGRGSIEYIPFAASLRGKYQFDTEADLRGLRAAGYEEAFLGLDEGIARSIAAWESRSLVPEVG